MTDNKYTGYLYQADAPAAHPESLLRSFATAYEAQHGKRPTLALVYRGHPWPEIFDGIRVIPDASIAYPGWMLLCEDEAGKLQKGVS